MTLASGRLWRVVLLLWVTGGLAPAVLADAPGMQAQPEAATATGEVRALSAPQAMVVTANPHASEAALEVLREGGHAVDAAIAATLVLNVVEPQSSGIGGGAFMLVHDAEYGVTRAWDGRETAPGGVDETLFVSREGGAVAFFDAVRSGRGVGVPGLLAMLEAAHERDGRVTWARLFEPAIRLAEEGFSVSPRLHALIAGDRFLGEHPRARAMFFDAEGAPLEVGARLRNPELAQTLRRVANDGAQAFYEGDIAQAIVDEVADGLLPGTLSLDDLAAYRAIERAPLCGGFRDHVVCGMPPPSAGGATVLSMLGILERLGPQREASYTPDYLHRFSEAGRLAYSDRDAWYGDPESMPLTPAALLAPDYLDARAALVVHDQSLGVAPAGQPRGSELPPAGLAGERSATTHLSIVDGAGNAVSLTASIESAFGSRRMVRGFLLNNQLTDFAFLPEGEHGPHPNRAGPGKRPRSSMAPTLVFDREGGVYAVSGSPGGARIINYVVASLVALLEEEAVPEAIVARVHVGSRNGPTEVESGRAGDALAEALATLGHEVERVDMTSGLALIVREGDGWRGAADPRREGAPAGF